MNHHAAPQDPHHDRSEGMTDVLVLLCESLSALGSGLDLSAIRGWLQERHPGVGVDVVADLCDRPGELSRAETVGAKHLVLGVCSGGRNEVEMQYRARKAGVDPLAVERVNIGDWCVQPYSRTVAADRAKVLLSAAVARAQAFPGSRSDDVKPYLLRGHQKVSRRALFTLPPIGYRPVASIAANRCDSEAGCDLCAATCPEGALAKFDGNMTLDRSACVACGVCVAECPRGAIHLPRHSPSQVEAEITELLTNSAFDASQPRALLFACQRKAPVLESLAGKGFSHPAGWLPVTMPCAGMMTATMILQSFVLGAAAVGVVTCGGRCPWGQRERIEGRLDFCREFLRVAGHPGADVRLVEPSGSPSVLADDLTSPFGAPVRRAAASERASLSGPSAAAAVLRALSDVDGGPQEASLTHAYSPLGVVHVDGDGCTGCGSCARICPTGAISTVEEEGSASLIFDPALCTGCGLCVGRCPEQAMRVDRVADPASLARGRTPLWVDTQVRCDKCGAVVAPQAMLRRVEAILSRGDTYRTGVMTAIGRRCPSCRGLGSGNPAAGTGARV
jgi:ferredoxin